MQDFNYIFSNCVEITIEMSCCKHPLVGNLTLEWQNNAQSFLRFLRSAHMGIKGTVKDTSGRPISGKTSKVSFHLSKLSSRCQNSNLWPES